MPRCRRERWRSACSTRTGPRSPNHPIVLGMVKEGDIQTRNGKSDAAGQARFTDLPVGPQTGYAAVIDWKGLRLNTVPFGMPESGGARAEIRALARTADPAAITIGAGGRIVVQMREDTLQILEFLPLENTSDKMFDPGPGAFEIPLPSGFVGAQAQDNERKVEVRQNHGMAVHGPIVPQRSQLIASDDERKANEVVFGFVLPYHGGTHDFSAAGAERNRRADPDHRPEGHRPHRQRPRRRAARGARAGRPQSTGSCPSPPSPPGARVKFTLSGLPSNAFQRAVVRGRRLAGAGVRRVRVRAPAGIERRAASGVGRSRRGADSAWSASARRCSASWSRWSGPRA